MPVFVTPDNLQTSLVTVVTTAYVCWFLLELLERQFRMEPTIQLSQTLHDLAQTDAAAATVTKRMTRTLDKDANFRIQIRGSVYFIKFMWQFTLILIAIAVLMTQPSWYAQHFYQLKAETVNHPLYQITVSSVPSVYLIELCVNRYAKLSWPMILHHVMSVTYSGLVMSGMYSPVCSWFGLIGIAIFPCAVSFALGFRSVYACKYPKAVQHVLKLAALCYAFGLVVLVTGYVLISTRLWQTSYYDVTAWSDWFLFFFLMLALCVFQYDDWNVVRVLFAYSKMDYRCACIPPFHEK